MGFKTEEIIKDYQLTGELEVNVDNVVKMWNHLWVIYEWRDSLNPNFRLVKRLRKDSEILDIKCSISTSQAMEIINRVELFPTNQFFPSSYTWRRKGDIEILQRRKKK
jgi:hypothetical protein